MPGLSLVAEPLHGIRVRAAGRGSRPGMSSVLRGVRTSRRRGARAHPLEAFGADAVRRPLGDVVRAEEGRVERDEAVRRALAVEFGFARSPRPS